MEKTSLWDETVQENNDKKFIIKAYINKRTNRQMYLSGWDDCYDFNISAVPYATTKERCEKIIKRATTKLTEEKLKRYPKDMKFEIVEA